MTKKKSNAIHRSGKRKMAIARVTLVPGTGRITINNLSLEHYGTPMLRDRILEPIKLAGGSAAKLDVKVKVMGGGQMGQADAVRLAIGRALVDHNAALKSVFLDYDRQLLVADVRRKEPVKPNSHGKARAKKQKSYR
ncbi:30S ribosomal protein S9 [Candidatus Woesearchaeota archaeon]|nr:30S ribosomal protein S9 [Candidatus Woesearchaeota archaeon]